MKTAKLIALAVVSLALILIVVQNTASVKARFLWFTGEVPAIVLLILTVAGGFIVGLVTAILVKNGGKS